MLLPVLVLQVMVLMGAELDAFIIVELVVHAYIGAACVVADPTHVFRRRIDQSRRPGSGCLERRILGAHHRVHVGAAMPMAGLTTDASHLRGLLDGNETAYKAISGGVAGQTGFIMRVILVRIEPSHPLFLSLRAGLKYIKAVCH